MVAGARVHVERMSDMVRLWIHCEERTDRRPQGSVWLELLGERCYHLLNGEWREELAEGGRGSGGRFGMHHM